MLIKTDRLRTIEHHVDFCVVGGGLSGMFAAISAAREGARVVLMQDRPVLGGNASSEIRMWVRGAAGSVDRVSNLYKRETGLISELEEENIYVNPYLNYSVWDGVLWNMVAREENITLLLNCSCADADMSEDGKNILCVRGWQLTTYTWHTVYARYFADCSGDSILAPITGALWRVGREGNDEYNETIGPPAADRKTMGMSCLIQARETDHPVEFKAPPWAYVYKTDADFNNVPACGSDFGHCSNEALAGANKLRRSHKLGTDGTNFWWIELGGEHDSIHDTEMLRDELVKIAYGIWDHIKNRGDHGAENWELEWIGFLPGKRESRRYIGPYVLTQRDIEAGGKFDDIVAYGGWPMDDHNPGGFYAKASEPASLLYPTPSPYGIPYRVLYSKNIANLFFAGRNISATHAAISSTRVMGTCSLLGQAMGTAAGICIAENATPHEIYEKHVKKLQKKLMDAGCWLPGLKREIPALSLQAKLNLSDSERSVLFSGIERDGLDEKNHITLMPGGSVRFSFDSPEYVERLRVVFDPDFSRKTISVNKKMRTFAQKCCTGLDFRPVKVAATLVRAFEVWGDGELIYSANDWHHSLLRLDIGKEVRELEVKFLKTWGAGSVNIFSCDIE
ncbi:MAG TPA: FAD-dependent oxidoreductase [Clostridiales bacterium]|jgi:hypothetical protein|nr:FAD-dependent oxidoreductase [Clostridiales bacterium]